MTHLTAADIAQHLTSTDNDLSESLEGWPGISAEGNIVSITMTYADKSEPQHFTAEVTEGKDIADGVKVLLSFSDADPVMTCQCGAKCFGDSVNDALIAWGKHVTTEHREDW
jgi:hypothetical protein